MNASFAIRVWGVQGALLHGCRGISGLLSRPTRTQPIALRQTLTATHKSHLTIASASRHTQFGHIVETTTSGSVTTGAADAAGAPGECDGESTSLPPPPRCSWCPVSGCCSLPHHAALENLSQGPSIRLAARAVPKSRTLGNRAT